jgi:nitrate reductase cytochrome c-type subunit
MMTDADAEMTGWLDEAAETSHRVVLDRANARVCEAHAAPALTEGKEWEARQSPRRRYGHCPSPSEGEHAMIPIPHDHHGDPAEINECLECRAWAVERLIEQSGGPCVHFAHFVDERSASAAADELANCRTRVQHSALQERPWALLVATNGDQEGILSLVERHGGAYGGWEATVDAATGEAVVDPDGP